MWKIWLPRYPLWAPENEGAGGDTGGDTQETGNTGDTSEDQGNTGDQSSSILDFANKDTPNDGGDWSLPEGMQLPDHLVGTSADDTLSKVAKAYQGARRELSQRGKGDGALEGSVPDSPDGYVFEPEGDDDAVAAELNSEASKPYVDAFRTAAHKLGIPDKAFSQLMREGLAGIAENGIPIGVSNEDAQKISGEQEMAALVSEVGQKEAGTIVNTISTYADKLSQRGILQGDEDMAEFSQMVGTSRAARIFHRILTGELGEKPIPMADGADGTVTPQEAYAKHAEASRLPAGAERDAAMQEAQRMMTKAFGEGQRSGSIKSSVL